MARPGTDRQRSAERYFEVSLLGLLSSGYLAVVGSGYLDQPTALLTLACLLVRAWIILRGKTVGDCSRWSDILTLAYIGFFPVDYYYVSKDFVTATVHMVFFTACQKLLFGWKDRDYLYLKIIAFMELLAAAIVSNSSNFFVFLAFFVLFGVATFASGEIRRSLREPATVVRTGMRGFGARLTGLTTLTVLGILVLTGGLFFLLPRTARAAFQHLVPSRYHLPGFSNEVTLGQIGELKMDSAPVMHVKFETDKGAMPAILSLKWRGTALGQFDGKRWFNNVNVGDLLRTEGGGQVRLVSPETRPLKGRRLSYEVQLKNVTSNTLFFAGVPETVHINVPFLTRTPASNYRFSNTGIDRLRYSVVSWFSGWSVGNGAADLLGDITPAQREQYLGLPDVDPRIRPLALEAVGKARSAEIQAYQIETYLRKTYGYTTQLPDKPVSDPLAYFLFERRKGHCEYFASSMAVMLRTLGIPSRVVTGFQGGTLNPVSGWYVIRASDAHSWVEAWFPGRGWLTFDPTPPDPNVATAPWFAKLNFYMDAMDVFWQDWVLSYDLDRQLTLAARMEESRRSFSLDWMDAGLGGFWAGMHSAGDTAKRFAGWVVAVFMLLGLGVAVGPILLKWWRQHRRKQRVKSGHVQPGDATLLYERMLEVLRRRGFEKPVWLTPQEFTRVLPDTPVALLVSDFTAAYNEVRFGGNTDAATRMVHLLEQLEMVGRPS